MSRVPRLRLLTLLVFAACRPAEPPPESTTGAIASVEGSIEAAVDAPWRLEPMLAGGPGDATDVYPSIPIVISVHDAAQQEDADVALDVGRFCGVSIEEHTNGTLPAQGVDDTHHDDYQFHDYAIFIPATSPQVREIEVSGPWPATTAGAIGASLCRQWAGEDCTLQRELAPTVEWHATVMYAPQQYDPSVWFPYRNGDDVRLEVTAIFAPRGRACPANIAHYASPVSDRLALDTRGYHSVSDLLTIHLGEAPLPRFDDGWVYGDLHYHAQGTDNEGESAYAHRPVLQAMRAIGLDFAFATDHASDSADGQVTDADDIYIDNVTLPGPHFLEEIAEAILRALDLGIPLQTYVSAARDMHETRYRYLVEHLNAPRVGANAQVLEVAPGPAFAPQLFQGGEVDVVPEVSAEEARSGALIYGYDTEYRFNDACFQVPPLVAALPNWSSYQLCAYGLTDATFDPNRFTVNDIQIFTDQYHARQHLLHLPTSDALDTFVSGRTSVYGGATRALSELLQRDYNEARKGVVFLAHPAEAAMGNQLGRLGPDLVPYSRVQLETAFGAEDVLGLQLWNEDYRRTENLGWQYGQLLLGAQAWDRMLQWGLQDSRTRGLSWLPAGEPRRVFAAGGSDAHGDLNYRRLGRRGGHDGTEDTAIGKPRNLVFVGEREQVVTDGEITVGAVSQRQVTTALRSGNFSVTDGPIVRIVVDTNLNGEVDDSDVPMGGVAAASSSQLPLVVEWRSTHEFGLVEDIAIYLGVSDGERTLVYASPYHGVRPAGLGVQAPDKVYRDPSGVEYTSLNGGYMLDPTGALFIRIPVAEGLRGRRAVVLDLARFPVATLHEQPGEPGACMPNVYCNRPSTVDLCEEVCEPDEPATLTFRAPRVPVRAYARAFLRTRVVHVDPCTSEQCIKRLAYSNPVWSRLAVVDPPQDLPGGSGLGGSGVGATLVGAGGACRATSDCVCSAYCAIGEVLGAPSGGVCTPRHKDGACTATSECVAGAYCARGECVPRPQLAASCDRATPCAPGLLCDEGVCAVDLSGAMVCH